MGSNSRKEFPQVLGVGGQTNFVGERLRRLTAGLGCIESGKYRLEPHRPDTVFPMKDLSTSLAGRCTTKSSAIHPCLLHLAYAIRNKVRGGFQGDQALYDRPCVSISLFASKIDAPETDGTHKRLAHMTSETDRVMGSR